MVVQFYVVFRYNSYMYCMGELCLDAVEFATCTKMLSNITCYINEANSDVTCIHWLYLILHIFCM